MTKIMLVTGGSRGIGAAISRKAAACKYDVAVNYTAARERADEVVKDVQKLGQRAIAVQADWGVLSGISQGFLDHMTPHSSLGYRSPAPETILRRPTDLAYASLCPIRQGATERQILS